MKIILQEDVANLGKAGDLATVRDGYGRNFLLPQGKAVPASERNLRQLEHHKRVIFTKQAKQKASAEEIVKSLAALQITIARKVGEQDKLYGSVTNKDIADAAAKLGVEIDRHTIDLPEPLRALGTYDVAVKLHSGVNGNLKVWVVAE